MMMNIRLLKWPSTSISPIKLVTKTINQTMMFTINRINQSSLVKCRALQTLATNFNNNVISHSPNVIFTNTNLIQSTNRQLKRPFTNNNNSSSSSDDDDKFITDIEIKNNFFTKTEILEIYKSTFKGLI